MFMAAMFSWGYILYLLYVNVEKAAQNQPDEIKLGLKRMRMFILFGWAIYPLGYFATLMTGSVEFQIVREFIYNIADLVNKVGFGLVAVYAAKAMSDARSANANA
jgi:bacteriorhodopsin